MRTLRSRLILSHILPLLLVMPLVGVTLIYILETQVLLASLSEGLAQQGAQMAAMANDHPLIWSDSGEAQHFVALYSVQRRCRVLLIDSRGHLLASTEPSDQDRLGQRLDLPYLNDALSGKEQVHASYSQSLRGEIVQVLVPVLGPDQEIMGVVRMSQQLSDLGQHFGRLRTGILGALAAGLLLGVILGSVLALNLGRLLQGVTDAIYGVASGREWQTLPEQGPQEIRLLLRAFNTLIQRLRLLEESRRHLLANLVHELGRPIGALQSALQALLSGADEERELRRELLEGMNGQVGRLRPLIDSLTDLHGQVLGAQELDLEPVALSNWLPGIISPWRQAAQDKGLTWRVEIPDDLPVLEIDADRIAQVLGNLLSNAIKYTPEGTISVEAGTVAQGVAIVVCDTGIGIAPDEQDRIFEPFYRSSRDNRFPQGMGLGLSIARDLVIAHGGRLGVESTLNHGSRFTVWLPVAAAQVSPPDSSPEDTSSADALLRLP